MGGGRGIGDDEDVTADSPAAPRSATLMATTCTTGWFDWVHGELWLCPTGLFRRSLGLFETIKRSMAGHAPAIDPRNRPTRVFSSGEIQRAVERGRTNRWVTWPDVKRATLKRGIIDHSLHLELANGKLTKFLWLQSDGGFDLLEAELARVLPGRFRVVDAPIG